MTKLLWDQVGDRLYETGVDHGVLFVQDSNGLYPEGTAWNGLTTVTESPSGAESNKQYADNMAYLNLISAEEFGFTIEAFTSPIEFDQCDGSATPFAGISIGSQRRRGFGFSYRSLIGNDVDGTDYGYKLHLVYGATAAPSEKARATVNDSPEALALSWECSTTGVAVEGTNPDTGKPYRPSAHIVIDSTQVDPTALAALEDILYGTGGSDARLPLPAEVIDIFDGSTTLVNAINAPTFNSGTNVITIVATTGVIYKVDGVTKATGAMAPITKNTTVTATPAPGYVFANTIPDVDFGFVYTP